MPARPARNSNRLPQSVAALLVVLVVTLGITGFVSAQKDIVVVVDGQTRHVTTSASDVSGVLKQLSIRLRASDVVSPAQDAAVQRGMTITVRHAVRLTLLVDGTRMPLEVVGDTVGDALVAAGLSSDDIPGVVPSQSTRLRAGMIIQVPDAFTRVSTERKIIKPKVRHVKDPNLPSGSTRLMSRGKTGRLVRVYRSIVSEGASSSPILVAQRVLVPAEPRVIAVGSRSAQKSPVSKRISKPDSNTFTIRVSTTGYSPRQAGLDFTTATGDRARRGVAAVDPSVIPLGTRFYVPGYGYAVAADTGGGVRGRHIDLCFDTVSQARAWGRRTVTIVVQQ